MYGLLLGWAENHCKAYWTLNTVPFLILLCVLLLDFSLLLFSRASHSYFLFIINLVLWHKYVRQLERLFFFSWGNGHGVKELEHCCLSHPFPSFYLDVGFRIDQCSAPQYWYPVHKVSSIEAFAQMNGENSRVIPWHRTFSLQNGFSTMN